jgi:uncharacterized protein
VTAREYGQTEGILDRLGIPYDSVGRHGGRTTAGKGAALISRSARLWRLARGRGFDLAIGHGSVDLAMVSSALRVPSVTITDYEYAGLQRRMIFRAAQRVITPDAIPPERLSRIGAGPDKLHQYPGLKEDYYLADFKPDPAVLDELGVDRDRVLVVVRPPPETSAYHAENPVYEALIDHLGGRGETVSVVIPRTERQGQAVRDRNDPALIVPPKAIDGQSLIAYADLVVGAGGTMNREAVALGTPVYTIFSGRLGAVDERLIAEGKLRRLGDPAELELVKRSSTSAVKNPRDPGLWVTLALGAVEGSGG